MTLNFEPCKIMTHNFEASKIVTHNFVFEKLSSEIEILKLNNDSNALIESSARGMRRPQI